MRTRSTLIAGLTLLLGITPSAEAQFGRITRKAQEAVTKEAKPGCAAKFDSVVVELKGDMVTQVVAGLRASGAVKGRGGLTPQEMMRRAAQATEERNALMERHSGDLERYQERTNTHAGCMNEALDRARQERQDELQRRILSGSVDAALLQDILQATMKQQELMAAGDTAGAQKVALDLLKKQGWDAGADSAKALKACGPVPPKPAWLVTADSLNDESIRLLAEARALEQRADTVGARAAGLGAQQYAVAKERVVAYVRGDGKPGAVGCFTGAEYTALDARMSELKELLD